MLNVVVGDPLIADDDAGDAFMVTVTFSGAMNQAVTPTLTFAPALTSTLTGGLGSWTDGTTIWRPSRWRTATSTTTA